MKVLFKSANFLESYVRKR